MAPQTCCVLCVSEAVGLTNSTSVDTIYGPFMAAVQQNKNPYLKNEQKLRKTTPYPIPCSIAVKMCALSSPFCINSESPIRFPLGLVGNAWITVVLQSKVGTRKEELGSVCHHVLPFLYTFSAQHHYYSAKVHPLQKWIKELMKTVHFKKKYRCCHQCWCLYLNLRKSCYFINEVSVWTTPAIPNIP